MSFDFNKVVKSCINIAFNAGFLVSEKRLGRINVHEDFEQKVFDAAVEFEMGVNYHSENYIEKIDAYAEQWLLSNFEIEDTVGIGEFNQICIDVAFTAGALETEGRINASDSKKFTNNIIRIARMFQDSGYDKKDYLLAVDAFAEKHLLEIYATQ